mmetsp:Transcript_23596/g.81689  ORF Transcript_23596/g.81689 Transcript_23596/m.81689 type:complete len:215 (+) Transcript_23596:699-1343(+)
MGYPRARQRHRCAQPRRRYAPPSRRPGRAAPRRGMRWNIRRWRRWRRTRRWRTSGQPCAPPSAPPRCSAPRPRCTTPRRTTSRAAATAPLPWPMSERCAAKTAAPTPSRARRRRARPRTRRLRRSPRPLYRKAQCRSMRRRSTLKRRSILKHLWTLSRPSADTRRSTAAFRWTKIPSTRSSSCLWRPSHPSPPRPHWRGGALGRGSRRRTGALR